MKAAIGYASQPKDMDPRSTEAWALAEASRRLMAAARVTDDAGESLRAALVLNQRLWSIFQASLVDPGCELPKEIRSNVLALSVLMDRHILQRLGDLDGSKIQPIVDINRSVAEGLSMTPAGDAQKPAGSNQTGPNPSASVRPTGVPQVGTQARPFMNVTA